MDNLIVWLFDLNISSVLWGTLIFTFFMSSIPLLFLNSNYTEENQKDNEKQKKIKKAEFGLVLIFLIGVFQFVLISIDDGVVMDYEKEFKLKHNEDYLIRIRRSPHPEVNSTVDFYKKDKNQSENKIINNTNFVLEKKTSPFLIYTINCNNFKKDSECLDHIISKVDPVLFQEYLKN